MGTARHTGRMATPYTVTRTTTIAAPAERVHALVFSIVKSMDSLIGPDFEKGFARLKRVAEQG